MEMDASPSVVGLDAQGNMVFTVVKPVMGIFQVSAEQTNSVGPMGGELPGLSGTPMTLVEGPGQQSGVVVNPAQIQAADLAGNVVHTQEQALSHSLVPHVPFAEVSSLLDPNMKGSKARKYLISYEEIQRRLQPPERMSLRSLAAYTRVSRGPASKKTLLESLNILGLSPSTTTAVSSSFSKLTEGDTRALCHDMKDFSHDYIDFGKMAKQLIPETNTVQHWSKIIETKTHLEDMRKCFRDPVNSGAFDNVTHGLGLGMIDITLDMIAMVIDRQIRILSGAAASDPADSGPPMRRIRRRHRKPRCIDDNKPQRAARGVRGQGKGLGKGRGRGRKKVRPECEAPVIMESQQQQSEDVQSSVLTLVSVGYETISSGLTTPGAV
ncbi:uncharacterized protein si:ch73-127m5.2 [Osmerus mordax]|uniref:uncharacterized protein si:ch73-127m5.2 n=1 Tax=Osmerus mordax TaxID=8014 RepID=UPI00351081CF